MNIEKKNVCFYFVLKHRWKMCSKKKSTLINELKENKKVYFQSVFYCFENV